MGAARDIVYWQEPIKSGIVATVGLTLMLSLSCMSFISVVAYAGLALFCCTTALKLYDFFLGTKKSERETSNQSLDSYLYHDIQLPQDKIAERVAAASEQLSERLNYLRRVILIQDYFEVAKLTVCLYLLSVIGSWFNLLTLLIVAFVLVMTCPGIYVLYQPQLNSVFDKLKEKATVIRKIVETKIRNLRGPSKKESSK
ncbi:unnamed protein product [Heterobilharzia americana]|nr:unnamed protein product [Heterobilharzia americana]